MPTKKLGLVLSTVVLAACGPAESSDPVSTSTRPTRLAHASVRDLGDGRLRSETGLEWARELAADLDRDQAGAHCAGLRLGGHDDWRLPTSVEAQRLFHRSFERKLCSPPLPDGLELEVVTDDAALEEGVADSLEDSGAIYCRVHPLFELPEMGTWTSDRKPVAIILGQRHGYLELPPHKPLGALCVRRPDGVAASAEPSESAFLHAGLPAREVYRRALAALGEGADRHAMLAKAASWFREAIERHPPDEAPLQRAQLQHRLAVTLMELARLEPAGTHLDEAIDLYRQALQAYRFDEHPERWMGVQSDLGAALTQYGRSESGTERLELAVATFRELFRRQDAAGPVPFCGPCQRTNLGVALLTLGERTANDELRLQAIAEFRKAARERDRVTEPKQWAMAQTNLGLALVDLAKRSSANALAEEAVDVYRQLLAAQERERSATTWAKTNWVLGDALAWLGERESGTGRLAEAIAAYRAALEVMTPEFAGPARAPLLLGLGGALRVLGKRQPDVDAACESLAVHLAAWQSLSDGDARAHRGWRQVASNAADHLAAAASGAAELWAALGEIPQEEAAACREAHRARFSTLP